MQEKPQTEKLQKITVKDEVSEMQKNQKKQRMAGRTIKNKKQKKGEVVG